LEVVWVPYPVVESVQARPISLDFAFPEGHPANRFRRIRPITEASLLYGTVTFTYSQARRVRTFWTAPGYSAPLPAERLTLRPFRREQAAL
jgi:hypothetical protein